MDWPSLIIVSILEPLTDAEQVSHYALNSMAIRAMEIPTNLHNRKQVTILPTNLSTEPCHYPTRGAHQ